MSLNLSAQSFIKTKIQQIRWIQKSWKSKYRKDQEQVNFEEI